MKALSTRNDDPTTASRPFDKDRDGFVMGEGASALIIESLEHAQARGAKIYGEIVGGGMTADAYHPTATHPEGIGALKGMEMALDEAGISAGELDYINAHATSTPVGDLSELAAIEKLIAGHQKAPLIGATKSMTGHLLGAAGAIEATLCTLAVANDVLPPTINIQNFDEAVPQGMHIISNEAKQQPVHYALSNTFGFGGHNATVIIKKFTE